MSAPKPVDALRVRIFADGADLPVMIEMARQKWIRGFTTNPTLMRKAGVADYRAFAKDVLAAIPDRPISFEVFSDEFAEMERQAIEIASWAPNVNVKIPVTNTRGEFAGALLRRLSKANVALNVTAVMTADQVAAVVDAMEGGAPAFVSVFAGRIADTGRDPLPIMVASLDHIRARPGTELIWASPRELLNVFQADDIGCHVITVTDDILKKLSLVGRDLTQFSLDTVQMFRTDAVRAGYTL
jgi:transaldolase